MHVDGQEPYAGSPGTSRFGEMQADEPRSFVELGASIQTFRGVWNFTWWNVRVLCTLRLWLTRRISHRRTNDPTVPICGLSRRPASGFSFRPARSDEGSRGEEGHTACQEPWAADNDRIHWVMQHIGAMLANP
jgi:hypothetical protein